MSVQDWGEFDGYKFTGDIFLPEKYAEAMSLYVLKEIYDELTPKYENELRNLGYNRQEVANMSLDYSFSNQSRINIQQMQASESGAPTIPLSAARSIYFEIASEQDSPDEVTTNGYTGDISVARDGDGNIVVSSTAADFNNYTFIRINNEDTNYELTNSATITIYVPADTDIATQIWNS